MLGPVQFLAAVVDQEKIPANIKNGLKKLHEAGQIRILDAVFVSKNNEGKITFKNASDLSLEQKTQLGSLVGALIGFGQNGAKGAEQGAILGAETSFAIHNYGATQKDLQKLFEDMEEDSSFLVMLIEHLWAKELKQAFRGEHVEMFAQGFLTPELLVSAGETLSNLEEPEEKHPPMFA